MKDIKLKNRGTGLEMRTFDGEDGALYLVFRTSSGAYHTFVEVDAKEAARRCGAKEEGTNANTQTIWSALWSSKPQE